MKRNSVWSNVFWLFIMFLGICSAVLNWSAYHDSAPLLYKIGLWFITIGAPIGFTYEIVQIMRCWMKKKKDYLVTFIDKL